MIHTLIGSLLHVMLLAAILSLSVGAVAIAMALYGAYVAYHWRTTHASEKD